MKTHFSLAFETVSENGIPEPPKVVSKISKLKEWLTTTREVIDTSKSISEGAKALLPYITLLIEAVSKLP